MQPFITLENISKTFYGVKALNKVAMTLLPGEVHCLAGQNGCGKSTLIKIISGVYQPDRDAAIIIDGKTYSTLTPIESVRLGIQVIYQDLSLFPNLTVAENIAMNHYHHQLWVHKRQMRETAERVINSIDAHLNLDELVENLSIAQKQLVAICRALAQDARLIVMDEPTASLTRQEVNGLLRVVHELKSRNICVVFVSHRLSEVLEISDRITVLKDGQWVGTYPAAEVDNQRLAWLMTDMKFDFQVLPPYRAARPVVLAVEALSRGNEYQNISLALHPGEIVALVGLLGSGRTELCLSLFGLTKPESGSIRINDKPMRFASNRDAIAAGVGYVSEDRMSTGLIMEQSIRDNISATVLHRLKNAFHLMRAERVDTLVEDMVKHLSIKIGNSDLPVNTLSGGNAQRIAIAKWLATDPKILILDSPTVGVDIANKAGIYNIINALAARGIAVLMVCDEIDEAYFNSHRIIVMRSGRLVQEFLPSNSSEAAIAEVVNG
ncbi:MULTISPECIES: sugar ABC transporter ATP-binding protein [Serratia]|jgi:simple sugar transport system ATP-binding protein|uniref:sugar ABC transporter ATP-binding protein n=1 Tax=Serratia TaxID=613 RepID=UPI0008100753|nr:MULTISPECIES: sugar ABC transporter ATP-binding protein [Serratia]MBC3217200.1 sugar ABC transporter ATP-binding protein [Serratia fonticola]MBC3229094.1 sugar ABC transporter ATP-binding protein [Serratia fonticola]MCO7510393.1 sugar ABC transporter ATP-binding protein [Serratia fonticola]OCJ46497.1 lipase [Serratia sp. 14-2641]CAI1634051.1 Ribose import ATP-binding protein RbsA [Serratia fonticola]